MSVPEALSCEFIVIDNHSNDDTRFVFEEIEKKCEFDIRYAFEPNRGISHARNKGINEANGEIIAFTDDDVIVEKNWIKNIVTAFDQHEDVACVGGKILPLWETQRPQWLNSKLYCYLALLDLGNAVVYVEKPFIFGANFAVKSEIFNKYGVFDANLGRCQNKLYSGEETEYLHRLKNGGEKLLYDPSIIVYHHVPAHRMSKRYLRKWRFDQGEMEGTLMGDSKYASVVNMHSPTAGQILFNMIASFLKICCFTADRFEHELRICHILGFLSARFKRKNLTS
jgi:GT2 family glycosyltransferase